MYCCEFRAYILEPAIHEPLLIALGHSWSGEVSRSRSHILQRLTRRHTSLRYHRRGLFRKGTHPATQSHPLRPVHHHPTTSCPPRYVQAHI